MKTYFSSLGVLLILSVAASAEQTVLPQGPMDLQSLRSQVMSRHFGPAAAPELRWNSAASTMVGQRDLDESVWWDWGLAVAPMPELLRLHCPKLRPETGLLIESVRPGSPAEQAGLVAGQVIAGTSTKSIVSIDDLPPLVEAQTLAVLVAGELNEVTVRPCDRTQAASEPKAVARSASTYSSASSVATEGPAVQAMSLAQANGLFEIEASYATAKGQQKVHLSGTRRQVDKSMADMPAAVRQAIESRLPTSPSGTAD
ncbi:MAG: hypothetical protein ACYC6Y_30165 [Thermoguttaceae bacterium]